MIRNILVYLDGSDESITASMYAIVLAKSLGCKITALYVINEKILQDLLKAKIFIPSEELDYERDLEQDAKRYLNYFEELSTQKGLEIEKLVVRGEVSKEVIKKAEEMQADMLVLGELKVVRSRRDVFYDDNERILRAVKCPVLIVKDHDKVEKMYESL